MKFRNQFFKYKVFAVDGDDGGAGGGGEAGEKDAGVNNSADNVDPFGQMWDNPEESSNDNAAPAAAAPVQMQPQPTAEEVFNAHVDGLGFGANAADFATAMQSQDPEQMQTALKAMQTQVYKSAMLDVNKVINQRVDEAVAGIKTETNETIQSNALIDQMETALPFTRTPAYAPMARAAIMRFLKEPGMTPENAIKKTGEYFSKFANDVQSGNARPPGNDANGSFRNADASQGQVNQANEVVPDWVAFLSGESPK